MEVVADPLQTPFTACAGAAAAYETVIDAQVGAAVDVVAVQEWGAGVWQTCGTPTLPLAADHDHRPITRWHRDGDHGRSQTGESMSTLRQAGRRWQGDEGFTLPELLITTVILGVIMASIGAAMIVALRTQDGPARTLGPSNDANLLANYFSADVQSASVSNTTATAASGCAYITPVNTSNVVALSWTDNAPIPPVALAVAYQLHNPTRTLRRVSCLVGQTPSIAVVARNITAAAAVVNPTVGSIRVDISVLDPQAPVGEPAFTFSLRAHGRLAGNDSGGGSGSGSGANQLPTGEILGSVTQYSDELGTAGAAAAAGLPMLLTQVRPCSRRAIPELMGSTTSALWPMVPTRLPYPRLFLAALPPPPANRPAEQWWWPTAWPPALLTSPSGCGSL